MIGVREVKAAFQFLPACVSYLRMSSFRRAFPAGSVGFDAGGYFGVSDCLLVSISDMVGMKVRIAPVVVAFGDEGDSWIGRISVAVEDITGLAGLVERKALAGDLLLGAWLEFD